jgi:hypothetical protein
MSDEIKKGDLVLLKPVGHEFPDLPGTGLVLEVRKSVYPKLGPSGSWQDIKTAKVTALWDDGSVDWFYMDQLQKVEP